MLEPDPPSSSELARIIEAAWAEDPNWGILVWLAMITGARCGELLAMRWFRVDLPGRRLWVRRNWVGGVDKDTKTHAIRPVGLDTATVDILAEHRGRYEVDVRALGMQPDDQTFFLSCRPLQDRPADPSGVTHRYARMCAKLGIDSHVHALRHYSATEILTAGVDLRSVVGRLGHAAGGNTTLPVYAAWVGESDRRSAEILGTRFPRPAAAATGG